MGQSRTIQQHTAQRATHRFRSSFSAVSHTGMVPSILVPSRCLCMWAGHSTLLHDWISAACTITKVARTVCGQCPRIMLVEHWECTYLDNTVLALMGCGVAYTAAVRIVCQGCSEYMWCMQLKAASTAGCSKFQYGCQRPGSPECPNYCSGSMGNTAGRLLATLAALA